MSARAGDTAKYNSTQRNLGMTQIILWVPQSRANDYAVKAEQDRIVELEKALEADESTKIILMATRNKRSVGKPQSFEDLFGDNERFGKSGRDHKTAVMAYRAYRDALKKYAESKAKVDLLQSESDPLVLQAEAELYIAGLKVSVAEKQIKMVKEGGAN